MTPAESTPAADAAAPWAAAGAGAAQSLRRVAYAQLHISVFLFGFTAIFGGLISLPAAPLVWWRLVFTVPVIVAYLVLRRQWLWLPWPAVWRLAAVGLVLGVHWLTFYGAIKLAGAAVALVCLASASLFTVLIEWASRGQRPQGRQLLQGLLVVMGIGLIFSAQGHVLGIAVGLASALFSALTGVLNKRLVSRHSAAVLNAYELGSMLIVFTLLIPLHSILLPHEATIPLQWDWLWILLLAWLCTNVAYELSMRSLRHLSTFDFILAINLEPIYGVVLAAFILGEGRDWNWAFFLGTALVFISVFFEAILKRVRG